MQQKEKEPFGMILKPSVTVILSSGPFFQKASKKLILWANSKEILSTGYAVTVLAGYVKFISKILDFYNVKPHTFVKLANLITISNFFFLDRYIYIFIYIYLHNWCIVNLEKSVNLTSHFALALLKTMLNCRWRRTQIAG